QHRRWSRCVSVREPAVEWEQGRLDRESEREDEEKRELDRRRWGERGQRREVEGLLAGGDVLADHADQHQEGTRQRVEDELQRRAARPVPLAEKPQQEVGGYEHRLPEHI